jgi:hypothetical protein
VAQGKPSEAMRACGCQLSSHIFYFILFLFFFIPAPIHQSCRDLSRSRCIAIVFLILLVSGQLGRLWHRR